MASRMVFQYCKHCGTNNSFFWDCDKDGFGAYCPKCGKPLPLCDECNPAETFDPQACEGCKFKNPPDDGVKEKPKKSEYLRFNISYFNAKYGRNETTEIIARNVDEARAMFWNVSRFATEVTPTLIESITKEM